MKARVRYESVKFKERILAAHILEPLKGLMAKRTVRPGGTLQGAGWLTYNDSVLPAAVAPPQRRKGEFHRPPVITVQDTKREAAVSDTLHPSGCPPLSINLGDTTLYLLCCHICCSSHCAAH
ncbi:unnamed protein product [Pleuronectes platessa]|uniref:Uncharacterized protein n=1 Tax=Pleuronectes platessa TaxID=8262 RepID=A0A9N7TTT6_PLEPL|nr:unnamed protein product [Pleuronectes platessa]